MTARTTTPSRRLTLAAALALTGTLALSACGGQDPRLAAVEGTAYMPEPVTQKMAAGFFTLTNEGDEADTLTSVTSELSDDVQLHETADNTMRRVESFEIPADGELTLSSGGNHLMFMGLDRTPSAGDTVTLKLHFEKSEPLTLDVPVKPKTYRPAGDDDGHDGHGAHG
ncbi:copper chaperone PCu(A)C [Streptomyces sp. JJ66]|uniref:copper chaperone PCu(A)C n=1 Tax=Streptomyces sp. JJ66 TaxID=2803843 RepID=UPI001C5A060F|nr:copper chaperone PCu(A)C [Streptomyces sp. JJ66]MBW1604112.1 copper chaperone PCu(A)C [Streptomyces sp. JJ66]